MILGLSLRESRDGRSRLVGTVHSVAAARWLQLLVFELEVTGMEAKELEVTADELKTKTEPKRAGDQP
jgi:hypothetical protein